MARSPLILQKPEAWLKESKRKKNTQLVHTLRKKSKQTDLERLQSLTTPGNIETFFIQGDKIADGAFGEVFEYAERTTLVPYAVKVISLQAIPSHSLHHVVEELLIMKNIWHESLVGFNNAFLQDSRLYLVLEYCQAGSLYEIYCATSAPFSESQITLCAQRVLLGLEYLHSLSIIHCDIKAANILLTKSGKIKIADFGCSSVSGTACGLIGTPYWMAPEVINNAHIHQAIDCKADIWSLGITCIELAELDPPFAQLEPSHVICVIPFTSSITLNNPDSMSAHMNDFIHKCLVKDPKHRSSATELLKHPLFSSLKRDAFVELAGLTSPWFCWSWADSWSEEPPEKPDSRFELYEAEREREKKPEESGSKKRTKKSSDDSKPNSPAPKKHSDENKSSREDSPSVPEQLPKKPKSIERIEKRKSKGLRRLSGLKHKENSTSDDEIKSSSGRRKSMKDSSSPSKDLSRAVKLLPLAVKLTEGQFSPRDHVKSPRHSEKPRPTLGYSASETISSKRFEAFRDSSFVIPTSSVQPTHPTQLGAAQKRFNQSKDAFQVTRHAAQSSILGQARADIKKIMKQLVSSTLALLDDFSESLDRQKGSNQVAYNNLIINSRSQKSEPDSVIIKRAQLTSSLIIPRSDSIDATLLKGTKSALTDSSPSKKKSILTQRTPSTTASLTLDLRALRRSQIDLLEQHYLTKMSFFNSSLDSLMENYQKHVNAGLEVEKTGFQKHCQSLKQSLTDFYKGQLTVLSQVKRASKSEASEAKKSLKLYYESSLETLSSKIVGLKQTFDTRQQQTNTVLQAQITYLKERLKYQTESDRSLLVEVSLRLEQGDLEGKKIDLLMKKLVQDSSEAKQAHLEAAHKTFEVQFQISGELPDDPENFNLTLLWLKEQSSELLERWIEFTETDPVQLQQRISEQF